MSCYDVISKEVKETEFYRLLKKRCGNSDNKIIEYFLQVATNKGFKDDFKSWYKKHRPNSPDIDFNKVNSRTIMNDVIQYCNRQHPDGNDTVMKQFKASAINYGSVGDRQYCISKQVIPALKNDKFYHDNILRDSKTLTYNDWKDLSIDKFFDALYRRIRETFGLSYEEVEARLNPSRRKDRFNFLVRDEDGPKMSKERAKTLSLFSEYLNVFKEILDKDMNIQNMNIQDRNLVALLDEMLDFHKTIDGTIVSEAFFDKIFDDPELRKLKQPTDKFNEEENNKDLASIAISDGVNVDEGIVSLELQADEYIKELSSHDGQHPTFMMHISDNVAAYFNSLPVLTSTRMENGNYDYDINNPIGLASTMNAKQVALMLYSRAKTDGNIQQFIESIREIAERNPGYEGFIKLYWDLKGGYSKTTVLSTGEEDTTIVEPMYAFAEELFDIFAKTAVAKKEIYIDADGSLKCRITNQATSPRESFRLQCINSIKYSSVKVVQAEAKARLDRLNSFFDKIKNKLDRRDYTKNDLEYREERRALINLITDTFKWYFPNVTLGSFLNYIDNEQHKILNTNEFIVDDIYNIDKLLNVYLKDIIEKADETRKKYEQRALDAANAKYQNEQLDALKDVDGTIDDSSRIDIDAIYAEDYLDSSTIDAARSFADALLKYSNVKTQLNSRNAAGNNSSDILNNNMLTYLKRIVEHEDNIDDNKLSPLNTFGRYKFHYGTSRQYDGSNLLVEHKDDDGNIINLGLFKKIVRSNPITKEVETVYEATDYAKELLKITLFNGTLDNVKSKSALYANMSKGDYFVSALTSFFNSNYDDVKKHQMAEYYLRTPSDAPKNFFLTMPRYSTKDLFKVKDIASVNVAVESYINGIALTDKREGGSKYVIVRDDVLFNLLIGEDVGRIYLKEKEYLRKDDNTAYVVIRNGDTQAVVKGYFVESGKNKHIEDVQLVGVLQNDKFKGLDNTIKTKLTNYYTEQISNSIIPLHDDVFVERIINRNHPIFRQLFNVAKQEITDAATAVSTLFEEQTRLNENGESVPCYVKNNTLVWKDDFAKSEDPDNLCETNYHHRSRKQLIEELETKYKDEELKQRKALIPEYKGSKVFYVDNNGVIKLTGKVFTSDRFTRFSELAGNVNANYFEDLFADGPALKEDGRIHILYGGYNTHLHIDEQGNVDLTDAQKEYVESRIEQFIIDYVDSTYKKANEYSNLFRENTPHNYDDIAEFILNYRLAYYACADLLEGDSKCYKSFTDFLKRAKEVQGAGVPYSALDYTKLICGNRELLPYSSLNFNKEIDNLINEGKLHDAKVYTVFRGVTVKNTVRTPKGTQSWIKDNLIQVITNSYKENGIKANEKKIEQKAISIMKGFEDVKTNDAQSYITFEEWIRRISMRGQLPKYLPLIRRICDESKPLTINDIEEFIQVQKNFYYDLYYDEKLKHMRPRQIKNAEFVLVPRLIKGTQLEQVYNTMIKHGIDQLNTVETSKAGKSNILTLWDNDGNLSKSWFSDKDEDNLIIKKAIEKYDYNFLYTQQETPQHANTENKAAIQLMKRVIDNIPQYVNGKEHHLWKAKQKFQKLYSTNIKESNSELLERLNVKYDENGNFSISDKDGVLGLDANIFCSMLKDELLRQAQDNDMLDYVTLNTSPVEESLTGNGYGLDTRMPIIANNSVRSKFESIAQALFNNNITRQTLPGFHAAQITGIGWKNTDEVVYNLIPDFNGTDLKKKLTAKEWRNLDSKDRVKYIPNNGIGVANDLAYHPAQYKHTKHGNIITEEEYSDLSENEQKLYKLNSSATYIEVRIPKSMFNFEYYIKDKNGDNLRLKTDEELRRELEIAGLNEFVGYRIPTEGKQSIAIMKVVGFVDDSYGSTIVVPDGWVAQTGSDFDIDSVYSVVFNNQINSRTGRIEKTKYRTVFNHKTYISYISRRSKNKITKKDNIEQLKDDLINSINNRRNNDYLTAYEDESEAYDLLEDNVKRLIKTAQQLKGAGKTRKEFAIERGNSVISALNQFISEHNLSDEEKNNIEDYIKIRQNIVDIISSNKYEKEIQEGLENIDDNTFKEIEEKAIAIGLPSYEQYLKLNTMEKNSKRARSNELISTMLDILRSDWSLEENLSQSNFREVTEARNRILENNPTNKISKESRSPYDFIDQADNMEEAISGRSLKGVSVSYDNVVSICNTARPEFTLDNRITVIYPITKVRKENGKTVTVTLDVNVLKRRFNEFETDENGKEILDSNGNPIIKHENVKVLTDEDGNPTGNVAITHTRFGWSNDNRNVDDFLITIYGSQTTAHQLDIIKEGAIPNVNNYTFSIYKLFPAIGSDYDTAVAFMMQPGITEIVNAYNKSKSIYSTRYEDPIRTAIIDLAKKLKSSVKYYGEAVELLDNYLKENHVENINVLNYTDLLSRINKTENDIAFDYLVIKKFENLKNISDKITAYSFVINPDKYGAKQTIFATNEILTKMSDILTDRNPVFANVKNAKGEKTPLLNAIFPGIYESLFSEGSDKTQIDRYLENADDEASVYSPLHYMFKYSTIPSIIVNRRLFQTQHPQFRNIINYIKTVMSGKNPTLSEDTEDSFTSYVISYLHNQIPIINQPIDYDYKTGLINLPKDIKSILKERARVYGFFENGHGNNFRLKENDVWKDFNPLDKQNPTELDVIRFMGFTPAQKVAYIQQNFSDGLACKYLNVNLTVHNKYDKRNPDGQSIRFNEEIEDINNVREEFRKMFMNENPLLRLTAIDSIKYAYIVEGRSRARNTVGKMIPNSILIESRETKGTGIVDALKSNWRNLLENSDITTMEHLVECYVRSHPNMSEISQCTISEKDMKEYLSGKNKAGDMFTIFDSPSSRDFILNKGIAYEDTKTDDYGNEVTKLIPNKYINITTYKKGKQTQTLYRIVKGVFDSQFVLYPLNKLEENEFNVNQSSNSENNKYYFSKFYEDFIDKWRNNNNGIGLRYYYDNTVTDEEKQKARPKNVVLTGSIRTNSTNTYSQDDSKLSFVVSRIREHFTNFNLNTLYMLDKELSKRITKEGSYKYINVDGVPYRITKMNASTFDSYINNPNSPKNEGFDEIINTIQDYGGHDYSEIYAIVPLRIYDPDTMSSTVIEKPLTSCADDAQRLINKLAKEGNDNAMRTHKINTNDGVFRDDISTEDKLKKSLVNTKEWVKREVEILLNGNDTRPGLNYFWKDSNGIAHKMTDPEVFVEMLNNPILHRSFLKTYLDILRLIETFDSFNYAFYTDQEKGLQLYVDSIKKEINDLKNNKVFKEAERLYVTEHLAKVSKNPNIQKNIISLLEGYHKTSFLAAHVNDLQDTSNPIIQIITKEVMADIRAKEFQAERLSRDFDAKAKDILSRAKAAGLPVDFDKIIDGNGNWIEEYNDKLKEDMANLFEATKTTYEDYAKSTGTNLEKAKLFEKYLQAKYEYDKFLLKNINREIEDNYYHELLQNLETMRYDDGRFLEIYVEYEMLSDRKRALQKQSDVDGSLDSSIDKQISELERKLKNLVSPVIIDEFDGIISKTNPETLTGNEERDRQRKINSYDQSDKLNSYLNTRKLIQDEYIKRDEKESFRETLDHYTTIINRIEDRDPITNIPRKSKTELAANEEYTRAKAWVRENAIFRFGIDSRELDIMSYNQATDWLNKYFNAKYNPNADEKDKVDENSPDFKYVIAAATVYFRSVGKIETTKNAVYKQLARDKNARDEDGVIDARKFSKEDLEKIRKEQLERMGLSEDNDLSERAIIHNSSNDDIIYKKSFYEKLKVSGITNPQYQKIVRNINAILRKAYMIDFKKLDISTYLNEKDLEDLLKQLLILKYNINEDEVKDLNGTQLLNFIDSIDTIDLNDPVKTKLGVAKAKAKAVAIFIKKNVDFNLTAAEQEEFNRQEAKAKDNHGGENSVYYKLWKAINYEWSEEKEEYVPNHVLWGHLKPKGKLGEKKYNDWVDFRKTAAIRVSKYTYQSISSKYYEDEQSNMIRKYGMNSDKYKEWYELNHIYNPNTHTFEPLVCWTVHSVNPNVSGTYVPTYNMTTTSIREGHENKKYRKGLGYLANYKRPSDRDEQIKSNQNNFNLRKLKTTDEDFILAAKPNGYYDRNINISKFEQEIKDLFQETLAPLAKTESSRRYLATKLPIRANSKVADKTTWLTEIAKTFGLVDSNKKVYWNGDNHIGYDVDYVPPMPMMQQLTSKNIVSEPIKEKYKTEEEYQKALKDYNEHKADIEKKNEEIHKSLIDKDWISVIKEFIVQAGHYNAIQDNKYKLYFGQLLLEDIKTYVPRPDTHKKLKRQGRIDSETEPNYVKKKDTYLIEQYNNWLHRLIFDHYKQSQGIGERIGNILQSFTSSSYMTLNLRGGIANILVGDANILGEVFAKEYFGAKEWFIAKKIWTQGLLDYLANAYNDEANTKVGAIIKGMNIVDYSELNGRITQVDLKKWSQIVNDIGFSLNNSGEHLMQNGAMIAMMLSHKVIENPNYGRPGEGKYIVVNFEEYTQNVREEILREICTKEQVKAYDEFIQNIKKNPDGAKNFAWYREDPITKFIADNFSKQQRKEHKDKVEKRKNEIAKTFKEAKTVYDQLDKTNDGYMTFAKGSIFEQINHIENNQEISDAYKLLGEFKGRVVSVNKKIHGNYGKLDSAQIEKFYLGRLLMQYHKHIPTGILKHYRREGYFNEERGTVEKGMYTSLIDFLRFPINAIKNRGEIGEDEAQALNGVQNLYRNILDYFRYLAVYNDIMPEYERANLRRMLGNSVAMLFAIAGAILIKVGWDDDEEDSIAYNFLIYEMDRLTSEASMWNPYGMFNEAKKQWSTPIAGASILSDCMRIMETTAGIIFGGEDYDPYYHSGRYAGRHKLGVYFERRIPYYRNYATLRDISDSNHYYKVGDNLFTVIPIDKISDWLKGK